jgi:hypothetical protein
MAGEELVKTQPTMFACRAIIVSCNPEVIGILHRHDTGTVLFCLVDGQRHGRMTGNLTKGVVRIEKGYRLRVHFSRNTRLNLHHAGFNPFYVTFESYDPVGQNSAHLGA